MNKLILKFTDNNIYIKQKDKLIIERIQKNIIKNFKIIDIENFIEELNKIIKKNKLNTLLIKNKISIIIPSYYNKTDIFLLDYTFKILNYYNYEFIKENKIYESLLEETNAVISLWDKVGELSYKEKNKVITIPYKLNDKINLDVENIIVINNTKQYKINYNNVIYLEPNQFYIINKSK